jgi:hypothetical protein
MRVDGMSASPKSKLKYARRNSLLGLLLLFLLNAGLALSQTANVNVTSTKSFQNNTPDARFFQLSLKYAF